MVAMVTYFILASLQHTIKQNTVPGCNEKKKKKRTKSEVDLAL